jgi:hypothetical protein
MAARVASRTYKREDVEEFDRKLRRFHESLAQKERRMLREIITAALEEEEMDVSGFANADDDTIFRALVSHLLSAATSEV